MVTTIATPPAPATPTVEHDGAWTVSYFGAPSLRAAQELPCLILEEGGRVVSAMTQPDTTDPSKPRGYYITVSASGDRATIVRACVRAVTASGQPFGQAQKILLWPEGTDSIRAGVMIAVDADGTVTDHTGVATEW